MNTDPHGTSLLSTAAAARRLGLAPGTLTNMRHRQEGPAYTRLGRKAVRYSQADLDNWIAEGRTAPGGQQSRAA